ncbi:DEAD-box ATP-dependent RNA helicase 7-like [Eucalyptus grandis]|uniref:DEAD-box ATP-dependent RNA helicase 7-like n=1 Tax=Eucalyptus grandis TaxID=71139 RepID=UPI00192E7C7F|nr:DEAD-box ATP-dependent RNA helicase 7-like [Eucalyptus grandis]
MAVASSAESDKKHKKEKKSGSKGSESKQPKLPEHQGMRRRRRRGRRWSCARTTRKTSETSSELVDPENLKGKKKKKKKARLRGGDNKVAQEEKPNAVLNFRILDSLRLKLKDNGIEALFPIQSMTFDIVHDGTDLVGRACTGQLLSCPFWNL